MIDSWLPSTLIFKAFRGWIKAWFLFFGGFVSGVQFNRLHPHTFAIYEQVYRSSLTFEQTHNGAVFFKRHLTWGSCVRSNLECDNVTSSMIRTGMHYSTQCVKKESWKKTIEVRIVWSSTSICLMYFLYLEVLLKVHFEQGSKPLWHSIILMGSSESLWWNKSG